MCYQFTCQSRTLHVRLKKDVIFNKLKCPKKKKKHAFCLVSQLEKSLGVTCAPKILNK